nr:MAG TPA: hypothetical protein [Caudoviricetes sp.]
MKTDFSPSNSILRDVAFVVIIVLAVVASFVLLCKFAQEYTDQLSEIDNTYARCKSVGGEMGYSKCFKNGKEI